MENGKVTMFELWQRHSHLRDAIIQEAGISRQAIAAVFIGAEVTQEEFEAALHTLNRLAGTHYTQEEITGLKLVPKGDLHEYLAQQFVCARRIYLSFSLGDVALLDSIVSSYLHLITQVIPESKESHMLIEKVRLVQARWREALPPGVTHCP
jgi:uncharacterized MAPEG superfamily protein